MHAKTSHVNYCSGTQIKVKTGFIDEGLELDQIKVLIWKTWILCEPNHRLIADQTMVYLPENCKIHHRFCHTQNGINTWTTEGVHDECQFQFYRQGTFEKTSHFTYVDFTNKIILQFVEDPPTVTCHNNVVFQSLEGLWVTRHTSKGKSANLLLQPLKSQAYMLFSK